MNDFKEKALKIDRWIKRKMVKKNLKTDIRYLIFANKKEVFKAKYN